MDFKELKAYQKAFDLAMEVFELKKCFPKEERYALIDQIRRSSRSVCSNLAEGYRKRRYPNHFIAKRSDADMENSETQVWLQFALCCQYTEHTTYEDSLKNSEEVGKLLGYMIQNPGKFR
jgi:four helix bundle protein